MKWATCLTTVCGVAVFAWYLINDIASGVRWWLSLVFVSMLRRFLLEVNVSDMS